MVPKCVLMQEYIFSGIFMCFGWELQRFGCLFILFCPSAKAKLNSKCYLFHTLRQGHKTREQKKLLLWADHLLCSVCSPLRVGVSSQMCLCVWNDIVQPTESIKGIMKMCLASLTVFSRLEFRILELSLSDWQAYRTCHTHKQQIVKSIWLHVSQRTTAH